MNWGLICLCLTLGFSSLTQDDAVAQEGGAPDMAAYMAAATPGEHHATLAKLAGNWNVTSTMWMDPAAPPMESTGTAVKTMLMDGRYLQEEYSSNFMGMPFNGMGITGYDNVTEQFTGVWFDNMSTMVMGFTGSFDAENNAIVCSADYMDAVSKEMTSTRMVTTLVSEDEHLFEYFSPGPDGGEVKSMVMVYKRAE